MKRPSFRRAALDSEASDKQGVQGAAHGSGPGRATPPHPEFLRFGPGRVIGGVCSGLGAHLGIDPLWVRLFFVWLAGIPPLAVVTYLALLFFSTSTDSPEQALTVRARLRIAQGQRGAPSMEAVIRPPRTADYVLVALAAALTVLLAIADQEDSFLFGALSLQAVGVFLVWKTFGLGNSSKPVSGGRPWLQFVALMGGIVLLIAGIGGTIVVLNLDPSGLTPSSLVGWVVVATLLVIAGFVAVLVPLWLRLWSLANAAAMERAAEKERAEIASRIHDSVLQTLTLVQKKSSEPEIVTLARSQERQLRQWLFGTEESVATATLFGSMRVACGEVEDLYGVRARPVFAGADVPMNEGLMALAMATREAAVNAAKHSGCEDINVFVDHENSDVVEVFVRDRGPGFDMTAIPADRQGVRESIIGRMQRAGGSVEFDSSAEGTEVSLRLPSTASTG